MPVQPSSLRAGVHHVHKALDAAADEHGHGVGRVVAGAQHHAVEQILHGHFLAHLHGHDGGILRDVGRRVGNLDSLGQIGAVFHGQQQRHDLGRAGRIHARVGVFLHEHAAVVLIHQQECLRVELIGGERLGGRRVVGRNGFVEGRERRRRRGRGRSLGGQRGEQHDERQERRSDANRI